MEKKMKTEQRKTEAQVHASHEFVEAKRVLENQSLKPFQCLEIILPDADWGEEEIRTFLRCLTPMIPEGCPYMADAYPVEGGECIIFKNIPVTSITGSGLALTSTFSENTWGGALTHHPFSCGTN